MSEEYTPTMDQIRGLYVQYRYIVGNPYGEFDRCLEAVRQKSYEEGYLQGFKNGQDISE